MRIARFLVGGVDLWLNNPRRPMEASGTSGMKAAINGIPSVSILDGWWDEGFTGENGWAIGDREPDGDEAAQDEADADEICIGSSRRRSSRASSTGPMGCPGLARRRMRAAIGVGAVAVQHGPHADRVRRPALPARRAGPRSRPEPPQGR